MMITTKDGNPIKSNCLCMVLKALTMWLQPTSPAPFTAFLPAWSILTQLNYLKSPHGHLHVCLSLLSCPTLLYLVWHRQVSSLKSGSSVPISVWLSLPSAPRPCGQTFVTVRISNYLLHSSEYPPSNSDCVLL